jgi:hypothetical protein
MGKRVAAPKAHWFWRFVFPLALPGLGIWAYLLNVQGARAVLDTNTGTAIELISDPEAAGFQAFAEPTVTMLVLHVDDEALVGISVLAETIPDEGGQVVLVSVDVRSDGSGSSTLAETFASDGAQAVADAVSNLFGFGFLDVVELPASSLGELFEPVSPLLIRLADDLEVVDAVGDRDVWLSSGPARLDGVDLARLYGFVNPGEAGVNRTIRQQAIWQSWLAGIGAADDLSDTVLGFYAGVPRVVSVLGTGQSAVDVLPVAPVDETADVLIYELNKQGIDWVAEMARRMVALPVAPAGETWVSVRLLNGTTDSAMLDVAIESLSWRTEIVVVGNVEIFGVSETQVAYHRQGSADAAEQLAEELNAVLVADLRTDQPVDMTVTIGSDWIAS